VFERAKTDHALDRVTTEIGKTDDEVLRKYGKGDKFVDGSVISEFHSRRSEEQITFEGMFILLFSS
jgi:hypothetical protein